MIHLDTHAAVWLVAGELGRFPPFIPTLLQQRGCAISPMVRLELDYLHEVGRIKVPGMDIVQDLIAKIGLVIDRTPFDDIVAVAAKLSWTRDPFDRLICANALAAGASLLSKDADVLANESSAFWDHPPLRD